MSDPERNATRLRERLTHRLSVLDEEKAELVAQLQEVEAFLVALRVYSDANVAVAPMLSTSGRRSESLRPRNPPREQVLKIVADALDREGRPMQLRELFAAVSDAGVALQGTDPPSVLGTMVWRAKERFTNIKGYGYWLADRPYAPARYEPPK